MVTMVSLYLLFICSENATKITFSQSIVGCLWVKVTLTFSTLFVDLILSKNYLEPNQQNYNYNIENCKNKPENTLCFNGLHHIYFTKIIFFIESAWKIESIESDRGRVLRTKVWPGPLTFGLLGDFGMY